MIAGVADTHAALWYLLKDPLLSAKARQFMDDAAVSGHDIVISPISLAEIVYLVEKNRLPTANVYADLKAVLEDPDHMFKEAPFTVEIVDAMRQVPRTDVPDMPDRIIAATAVYLGVPVISRDGKIRASNVKTIW
jgi:PIN domain nuclease of toxin-antitoxin system